MSVDIERNLNERFKKPLNENYRRRIIFWKDSEREFAEIFKDLHLANAKTLELTETNNFIVKKILSEDDQDSNYLVYCPGHFPNPNDDWLLDIELYSEEFYADLISIRMQELNIPATASLRQEMKKYTRFFDNKDRVSKFAAFNSDYDQPNQLAIDVLSVLVGTTDNTMSGIILAILSDELSLNTNEAYINIHKFGDEESFWDLIDKYTGYKNKSDSFITLAEHILLTALSVTVKEEHLRDFSALISRNNKQACFSLVIDWLHSGADKQVYKLARDVEEDLKLNNCFAKMDLDELLNSECFPGINETILERYMKDISDQVIKSDEIIKTVEKQRTSIWYDRFSNYYEGLLQVAKMEQFHLKNIQGFHVGEYPKLWDNYCNDYCQMDYHYRKFHLVFGESLKNPNPVLDDLYKGVADRVESIYKYWYLSELGNQWNKLVSDELSKDAKLGKLKYQMDFYSSMVKPLVENRSRVFVIISDALRYKNPSDTLIYLV